MRVLGDFETSQTSIERVPLTFIRSRLQRGTRQCKLGNGMEELDEDLYRENALQAFVRMKFY